jgi:hypothetical protein
MPWRKSSPYWRKVHVNATYIHEVLNDAVVYEFAREVVLQKAAVIQRQNPDDFLMKEPEGHIYMKEGLEYALQKVCWLDPGKDELLNFRYYSGIRKPIETQGSAE